MRAKERRVSKTGARKDSSRDDGAATQQDGRRGAHTNAQLSRKMHKSKLEVSKHGKILGFEDKIQILDCEKSSDKLVIFKLNEEIEELKQKNIENHKEFE